LIIRVRNESDNFADLRLEAVAGIGMGPYRGRYGTVLRLRGGDRSRENKTEEGGFG
jgi:hypothetical protein